MAQQWFVSLAIFGWLVGCWVRQICCLFFPMASQAPSVIFTRVYNFTLTNHQPALNHKLFTIVLSTGFSGSALSHHTLCVVDCYCKPCLMWSGQALFLDRKAFYLPVFFIHFYRWQCVHVPFYITFPFSVSSFKHHHSWEEIKLYMNRLRVFLGGSVKSCVKLFFCVGIQSIFWSNLPSQTFFYVCIYTPFSAGWWSKAINEQNILKLEDHSRIDWWGQAQPGQYWTVTALISYTVRSMTPAGL